MLPDPLAIALKLDDGGQVLKCEFRNAGARDLVIRDLVEFFDVIVQRDDGVPAEYHLHAFAMTAPTVVLPPAGTLAREIPLFANWIYDEPGTYLVWVDYDTDVRRVEWEGVAGQKDKMRVQSNTIRFRISPDQVFGSDRCPPPPPRL